MINVFQFKMILQHWNKLLTTECKAIRIPWPSKVTAGGTQLTDNGFVIYPIFKNGRTSLYHYGLKKKAKTFINEELKSLKHIHVFLREPKERFISGVNTYIEFENLGSQEDAILKQIEEMKICDRHFIPQSFWLMHLSKYFKGSIRLATIEELRLTISTRDEPVKPNGTEIPHVTKKRKEKIKKINFKNYIDVDKKIIKKYINKTVVLENLIKEFHNVLS